MTAIIAWAIKSPDGHFVVNTRNDEKEKALAGVSPETRQEIKDRGYVVVRVSITEEQ